MDLLEKFLELSNIDKNRLVLESIKLPKNGEKMGDVEGEKPEAYTNEQLSRAYNIIELCGVLGIDKEEVAEFLNKHLEGITVEMVYSSWEYVEPDIDSIEDEESKEEENESEDKSEDEEENGED